MTFVGVVRAVKRALDDADDEMIDVMVAACGDPAPCRCPASWKGAIDLDYLSHLEAMEPNTADLDRIRRGETVRGWRDRGLRSGDWSSDPWMDQVRVNVP